jgi:uncharacterized protein
MQEKFSKFKARYILLDSVLILFVFIVVLAIGLAIAGLPIDSFEDNLIASLIFGCLVLAAICLSILLRLKSCDIELKALVGNTKLRDYSWLMLLIIFYGIETLKRGISQLTIFFTHLIAPSFAISAIKNEYSVYLSQTDSQALKLVFCILLIVPIVIVAPITEEFIFRGVLLHRFAAKWGMTAAILLSSFLFGIAHWNIYALGIGVSFIFVALLYIKTRTLIVPIVLHTMHNAIALVSISISAFFPSTHPVEITLQTLWTGLLNTMYASVILIYFLRGKVNSELMPYIANAEQEKDLT